MCAERCEKECAEGVHRGVCIGVLRGCAVGVCRRGMQRGSGLFNYSTHNGQLTDLNHAFFCLLNCSDNLKYECLKYEPHGCVYFMNSCEY